MNNFPIYKSKRRRKVFSPAFIPTSPQVIRTNQVVSPTGAGIAIRPPRTAIRRMDNKGVGEVSMF